MSVRFRSRLPIAGAALLAALTSLVPCLHAQQHDWEKTYTVAAKPTLRVETADAQLEIHSCGSCHEIRIAVELRNRKLSDFRLIESQSGNQVTFELKEKPRIGFHVVLHDSSVKVLVETPVELAL